MILLDTHVLLSSSATKSRLIVLNNNTLRNAGYIVAANSSAITMYPDRTLT